MKGLKLGLGIGKQQVGSGGGGDLTAPEITNLVIDTNVTFDLSEVATVYMARNTDPTLLTGAATKAAAEDSWGSLIQGENIEAIDDSLWAFGPHQLHFVAEAADLRISALSVTDEYVKMGVPDEMDPADWDVTNDGTSGDITISIDALAADNFSAITDIEYDVESSGTGISLGAAIADDYPLSGFTDDVEIDIRLRLINGEGPGPWSTIPKPVTPTAGAGGIEYVGGKVVALLGTITDPAAISLTDLTGGLAAAPSEDDIVLIAYAIGAGVDVDVTITTADYIEIADIRANDDNDANLGVFRKFMTATPDTSITVGPTTNATYAGAVAIQVWRGVNVTTPMDVAATTATGTNTGQPSPAAITPTTSGAFVIVAGAAAQPAGADFTSSDLSNFITETSPDTIDATVGMGSFAWTSGLFTPATWGGSTSASTDSWAAVTLALRPA